MEPGDRHKQIGKRTSPTGIPVRNNILLSLPDEEYQSLRPALQYVELPQNLVLHDPLERVQHVHFLNDGLASVVVALDRGKEVEAGVIGYEGVLGTGLAVGIDRSPLRIVVQIRGSAFRLPANALGVGLTNLPELKMRLARFAVLQGMQVAQTAACNRLHGISHRLARWLLMSQDRVGGATIRLTQDFLATMLGSNRPSVSIAALGLRRQKAITYSRGTIRIVNRKRLEAAACPCYKVIQLLNEQMGLH